MRQQRHLSQWHLMGIRVGQWLERIIAWFRRRFVPQEAIHLYERIFRELKSKAWHIQRIQFNQFDNQEFQDYLNIRRAIHFNKKPYENLNHYMKLLEAALIAKDNFILIEETEMRFRSSLQQKIYHYLLQLITHSVEYDKLKVVLQGRLRQAITQIKTEEGRKVMNDYLDAIDHLASNQLSFELLRTFKAKHLKIYTVLRTVADLAATLQKKETKDLKRILVLVYEHQDVFEELGGFLGVPAAYNVPTSYAKILHYLALKHRYAMADRQFNELLTRLSAWEKSFLRLQDLREEYAGGDYMIPKSFKQPIPCLKVYQKYREHLDLL